MKPKQPFDKTPIAKTGKDIINLLLFKEKRLDEFNNTSLNGDIEIALFNIWRSLLGHGNFSVSNDFFEIGGNSIKAVQLVSRISKEFSVQIQLTDIFLQTTISQLAGFIRKRQNENIPVSSSIEVQTRPAYLPLSFSQERLWFIDQLEGSVEYNLPAVLRLRGNLDKGGLEYSLMAIADRHEVLRTVFSEREGHPYQVIKGKGIFRLTIIEGSHYGKDAKSLQHYIQQLITQPFDLSKDDMIRGTLLELSVEEHVLVVTMHHIAADAWSMPIIVREVAELYASYLAGRAAQLVPLAIQYADYAIWQRNYLQGEVLDKKISYWKKKLEGITALQLPSDYVRPIVRDTRGASKNFSINKELSADLQLLSQQQGATLYMTLLAAFNVLLYRYSDQEDITVGTSIANRSKRELEDLIGFFVNTLVLRSEVNGKVMFTEFLQQVKTTMLEAYEHQELPFEKVVEVVVKERDPSRSPLFQVMLVLRNTTESSELRLGEVKLSAEEIQSGISKFDITFFISETADGLQGTVEYATDLYNQTTISRMTDHFKELLVSIVKAPQQKIGELSMLTKAEEQQLLVAFNDTAVDYPKDKSIVDLFEEQAARTPAATAVVFEEVQLTYQQLNEKANQLAHYLRSKGVKQETLVPISIERSLEMIIGILGILKAGGAYVPIEPDFPEERKNFVLEDTAAKVVISSRQSSFALPASAGVEVIEIDGDWSTTVNRQLPTTNDQRVTQPHHLAYVIYTSGSTGKPKGVMIEHRHLVDYVFGLKQYTQIDQCKSYALVSSVATDLGNTVIYPSLVFGGALHIFSKESVSNIEYLHEYFKEHSIECLKIVPSHWKALFMGEGLLLPSALLVFGGEALQSELVEKIKLSGAGCRVINHYGPTETTIGKLLHEVKLGARHNKTILIGRPFSNTQAYILSKEAELCPVGIAGELHIAGDGVARGYLNNEELTRTKFINDPFNDKANSLMYCTGDLVRYFPDGNIEFIGRVDDQVKIRGYRVELGEIESIVLQSELVSQAVVLAKEDKDANKRLVGYVIGNEDFDKESLVFYLKEKLPDYMVPGLWMELEEFPLLPNGKIDRKSLPDPEVSEQLSGQYVAPRNEAEERLAVIWQDVLEVEQVGVHDDFFELGGHSLLAVRLISAIRKEFAVEMPISDVFDHPTIASLAAQLDNPSEATVLPTIEVAKSRPERIPLSFSQERLWFIDQLEGSIQYHVPAVLRLKGRLNVDALAHSLEMIVDRHEVLRTVFLQEEGKAHQFIKPKGGWELSVMDGANYKQDTEAVYLQQIINEPFDLAKDYMLRGHLISITEQEHILVVTLHHIASDGWSTSIIIRELAELYSARVEERPAQLAPLGIQYADFAIWQRNYLKGEVLDRKIEYWKNKLQGVAPLQLPADFTRPPVQSTKGAIATFVIEKEVLLSLQLLNQQQGTTLFMTLLSAFKVMLYRYCGQQDICVGTAIAGRQQQEVEHLIGFFINSLALRSEVSGDASFTELLQQVKFTTMEAYEHQEVPFEKVVEAVVKERDLIRSPLFQVMLILRNTPEVPELQLEELSLSEGGYKNTASKFDFTFFITESTNGLQGTVEYATDLYNEATIGRMMDHFKNLLSSIIQNPLQKIADLSMLTKSEEQQLLVEFNNTAVDYPKGKTIVELFEEQAAKTPGSTAVVFEDEQLNYQQLNEKANQLAHYLKSKGVKEETLVPICIERSLEMIVGILGILKAGGAYVPIDPEYPQERISYMLEDTGANIIITSKESRSTLQALPGVEVLELDNDWSTVIGQLPTTNYQLSGLKPNHLAYVIYTSGSTGKPKGVMIEHGSVVNLLKSIAEKVDFTSSSGFLSVTTFSFDICYLEFFMPLIHGGRLIVIPRVVAVDGFKLAEKIAYYRPTHMQATPSTWQLLLESKWENPEEIKILIGGEAVKEEIKQQLTNIGSVFNLYGPTETTIWSVMEKLEAFQKVLIGKPIANTNIKILDNHQSLVPIGVSGEICIGGDGLARGYLNLLDLSAEKFIKDSFSKEPGTKIYRTGDLGRWLHDGNIECLGRIDDQVKIRGYRIELGEIETLLLKTGVLKQAVVSAKESKQGNKRLVGYVVPVEEFHKENIIAYLKERLPEYMVPALWVTLERLPLTPNGKIDRKALPDPDFNELSGSEYVAPQNEIEEKLAAIWQELLGVEQVGIHDNFFELGGDSILTIQVVSQAKRSGYEMHPKDIFIHQTIGKLSKAIIQRSHLEVLGEQGILNGLSGLLPIQQRYLENDQADLDHFNQSILLGIDKAISEHELNQVVEELVQRHDALRFKYYKKNGEWQQEYGSVKGVISIEDLRSAEGTYKSSITEHANKHQQSLNIEKGELIRVVLMQMPGTETHNRLLIVIHHLAIDGVSWRILLDDMELLLNDVKKGRKTDPGMKSSSYRQWFEVLEKYGKSERLLSQRSYWQQTVKNYDGLPVDMEYDGKVMVKDIALYSNKLGAEHTRLLLQKVPRVYHTTINDLLLCAMAKTVCGWTGKDKIIIGLEGHGRDDIGVRIDTDRTVGWLTSLYPVLLEVQANSEEGDWIKSIKEQLRKVPEMGLGYGVLKYLNKEQSMQGDRWDVIFNYLGQFDNVIKENGLLTDAEESTGFGRSKQQLVNEKFTINCHIKAGELIVNWNYSAKHYKDETIKTLVADYISNLVELINHCMEQHASGGVVYTPSDYGLGSNITYKELDRFLHKEEDNVDNIMSF